MTKITHKGLWFEYSSLSKEDKKLTKKVLLSAILSGFFVGLSFDKSAIIMWSEILHPSVYYGIPLTVLITGTFTVKYAYKLYQSQDELYKKYHDFSLMSGFMGFAIFGLFLNYVSIYTEYQPQFMDYFGCSVLGMIIGQMYFYKKFY